MLTVVPDVEGEVKDYQEQLKQMLQDLAKEKEKDVEKPLPLMNQVLGTCCSSEHIMINQRKVENCYILKAANKTKWCHVMKHWYKPPSSLPPQREFIQFCKTLYSMFHGDPEENDLFQAIATVTSLVLQIGEAGHRGHSSGSGVTGQEEAKGAGPQQVTTEDAGADGRSAAENEWTVSYAQILASLLTEQALVNFFEKPVDLSAKIAVAKEKQYHQRAGLLTLQQGTS